MKRIHVTLFCLPLLVLALALTPTLGAQQPGGLTVGAKAPAFKLSDQAGKKQELSSLAGPNGLLLLFFRSADWCPFCKGQLVDLEAAQQAFAKKGSECRCHQLRFPGHPGRLRSPPLHHLSAALRP